MRTGGILVAMLFFGLNFAEAQKFGYIDTNFILGKMPEYLKAQSEIEQRSRPVGRRKLKTCSGQLKCRMSLSKPKKCF